MFCDLVGSTSLATRFDPEDLRELIGAYHRAVAEVVVEFDGFVAKYMGDGVLAYFGYPRAHEDDAERAVRAALGVINAVGRLDIKSIKLQARVGIATGLVVVGDLIGEGSAQEQSVVGETPNLAARLQSLAEPDAVVIAAGTRHLVGDIFEYRDLGAVDVKGIAGPVPAWQVLGQSVVTSRFEALHATSLIPLVGRGEEIELLLRRWARAKDGAGQVVLLSGEPGIGKSRIAAELQDRLRAEPHIRLSLFRVAASSRQPASSVRRSPRRDRRNFSRRLAGNEAGEARSTVVAIGRKPGRDVRAARRSAQSAERRRPIGARYRTATQAPGSRRACRRRGVRSRTTRAPSQGSQRSPHHGLAQSWPAARRDEHRWGLRQDVSHGGVCAMQLTLQQSGTEFSPIGDEVVSVAYTNARNRVIGGRDDRAKLEWFALLRKLDRIDQSYEQ